MNPDFFRELELRRTAALVARDMPAIEALHAPEYQLITPAGRAFSREKYLGMIASQVFYTAWECGPMAVRVSADMAAVRYHAKMSFPSGTVRQAWHTDIYERRPAGWQAVWSQATELPKPDPA